MRGNVFREFDTALCTHLLLVLHQVAQVARVISIICSSVGEFRILISSATRRTHPTPPSQVPKPPLSILFHISSLLDLSPPDPVSSLTSFLPVYSTLHDLPPSLPPSLLAHLNPTQFETNERLQKCPAPRNPQKPGKQRASSPLSPPSNQTSTSAPGPRSHTRPYPYSRPPTTSLSPSFRSPPSRNTAP